MKKQILTFAALATLAVGAAFASQAKVQQAAPPYYNDQGEEVDCTKSMVSCTTIALYSEQDPDLQDDTNRIPNDELLGKSFDQE